MKNADTQPVSPAIAARGEPWPIRLTLMAISFAFLGLFIALPLLSVFAEALRKGFGAYFDSLVEPAAVAAIQLTLITAAIAVPLNLVFGVIAAWQEPADHSHRSAFLGVAGDLRPRLRPPVRIAGLARSVARGA
jgi:sulfate transport system permease protein